ncbi:hypothetical protein [Cloacibacillus evryensis]|uniref:Uncharacterized protein n=1 Tax=Cloacibacillus evryensis TaxID=508460 RepID=A0AAW5K6F4_9BACT|nr:hypothetical protein [Cloacibacillus evryensis]MCQ4813554.1 hypothetical protein [Cloacibacillus evryensis]
MTFFEELRSEVKSPVGLQADEYFSNIAFLCCPGHYFLNAPFPGDNGVCTHDMSCEKCWNQEVEADVR